MGGEREAAIANMESMGFARADIDRAMRAAFFNPDRAVEYLLTVRQPAILPHLTCSNQLPGYSRERSSGTGTGTGTVASSRTDLATTRYRR
jgi:UV excision repair protein RAD23